MAKTGERGDKTQTLYGGLLNGYHETAILGYRKEGPRPGKSAKPSTLKAVNDT